MSRPRPSRKAIACNQTKERRELVGPAGSPSSTSSSSSRTSSPCHCSGRLLSEVVNELQSLQVRQNFGSTVALLSDGQESAENPCPKEPELGCYHRVNFRLTPVPLAQS